MRRAGPGTKRSYRAGRRRLPRAPVRQPRPRRGQDFGLPLRNPRAIKSICVAAGSSSTQLAVATLFGACKVTRTRGCVFSSRRSDTHSYEVDRPVASHGIDDVIAPAKAPRPELLLREIRGWHPSNADARVPEDVTTDGHSERLLHSRSTASPRDRSSIAQVLVMSTRAPLSFLRPVFAGLASFGLKGSNVRRNSINFGTLEFTIALS